LITESGFLFKSLKLPIIVSIGFEEGRLSCFRDIVLLLMILFVTTGNKNEEANGKEYHFHKGFQL